MKHVKIFEEMDGIDSSDSVQYLESPEYFVETYFNGQFGQLHRMLAKFREDNRMEELISDIKEYGNYTEIIEWIAKN